MSDPSLQNWRIATISQESSSSPRKILLMTGLLDLIVLASYLALVAGIGFWAARGNRSTKDYFLGGSQIPWWAAGLSILATETSALTFIGAPTQSLRGDWTYLQLGIGSAIARFLVAWILIRAYYQARVYTVYDYLGLRFGNASRWLASLLFFVGRSLGSGVRLYGAAICLVVVAEISFPLAISLIATVAVAYTVLGGIKSVIWTDALQGVMLVGGGVAAVIWMATHLDMSFSEGLAQLRASGTDAGDKARIFNFSLSPKETYTLLAGLVASTFLTLSTHGTDQDMVQRVLTCRDASGGRKSLIMSAILSLPVAALFLCVGSGLWLYYGEEGAFRVAAEMAERAGESNPSKGYDYVFLRFVITELPAGIRGLIVAGVFAAAMSSLDSAIAALSSTAVKSVWEPHIAPGRDEKYYLRASRIFAAAFGVLLVGVAWLTWVVGPSGSAKEGFGVLMLGLLVLTWIFPPLLGIFLVGVLTKRGSDLGNILAITCGVGLCLSLWFWPELSGGGERPIAYIWNSVLGCFTSFGVSVAFRGKAGTSRVGI